MMANKVVVLIVMLLAGYAASPKQESKTFRSSLPVRGTGRFHDTSEFSKLFDSLLENYDKRVRPNYGVAPVYVSVTEYIQLISCVSEVDLDYRMDIYFRQFWLDPRLKFQKRSDIDFLSAGPEFVENIWVPDTFFVNEKYSYLHKATKNNEFVRIYPDGTVLRSIRITITATCNMNFQYFPMDRQLCHLELGSFAHTNDDIIYSWKGQIPVEVSEQVSLPQFRLLGYRILEKTVILMGGNYSRLRSELRFERVFGYTIIQLYIPGGLFVGMSWVSFWLPRGDPNARVTYGIMTVLTVYTLMTSYSLKFSYITAVDVYLYTCFIIVLSTLATYAAIGKVETRKDARIRQYVKDQMAVLYRKAQTDVVVIEMEEQPGPSSRSPDRVARRRRRTISEPDRQREEAKRQREYQQNIELEENDPMLFYKNDRETGYHIRYEKELIPPSQELRWIQYRVFILTSGERIVLPKELMYMWTRIAVTPAHIDVYFRAILPVCFASFLLFYWMIYLNIANGVEEGLVKISHYH